MPTTPVKLAVMLALFLVAVSGCRSGSSASVEAPTSSDDETDWFCQEDGDSGEWYCIQDDELARNPEKAERGSR
ncbi:MAG: hypothetical protein OXH52_01685 [Gammaproteobacteria bacterium]|nr:hypothetical protein [Gammaproteobacteria bacterium]